MDQPAVTRRSGQHGLLRAGAWRRSLAGLVLSVALLGGGVSVPAQQPVDRQSQTADRSYYLPMADGVKLAVSLWFPASKREGSRHPVALIQTRYGRAGLFLYGEGGRYRSLVDQGYVVAVVDTRGSTSSFGDRLVEIGPEEVSDMETLIRYFRTQPWSDGDVVATGVSYMADTADFATASPERLTAAVIRQSDFDGYLQLFAPGGVANDFMMSLWGGDTLLRDYGRSLDPKLALDCGLRAEDCPKLWPRLQAVDGDADFSQLRAAIRGRRHWQPEDYRQAEYRDDKGANGYAMFTSSPASRIADIGRLKVPTQYWASWMDAGTAEGVLARYRSLPGVPMDVWITANNHGGEHLTDPLFPDDAQARPSATEQWKTVTDYLASARAGRPGKRMIHYYVLGAGEFRTTATWPPRGVKRTRYLLDAGGGLGERAAVGEDRHDVDFAATTGEATRWTTQIGSPAAYPDRREADRKLLTYTSTPFTRDMELVGTPSVRLFVATATADPAFFAYIEDVAPDGRVTYLTEGLFRAVHRKPAKVGDLPYAQPRPAHSFNRADALPMQPGVVAEIAFPTFPVAALIRKGHSLRLSLAGADAGTFRRYSEGKPESWRIQRGGAHPSSLSVDLRVWTGR